MTTQAIDSVIPEGVHIADPVHSSVGFAVSHNGLSIFRSGFRAFEARLTGGGAPHLEGTVDVASIDVQDEQLKAHLLSPDFFDAERHPELHFDSRELSVEDDGSATVRGELEIGGRSREVEGRGRFALLGADIAGKQRLGLSLEAAIDRRHFGLDWQLQLPGGEQALAYAVGIAIELELLREES